MPKRKQSTDQSQLGGVTMGGLLLAQADDLCPVG